ncbi:hypothetical protein DMH01_17670 [Amycolatopsis sp. WAC 04182]|nr:hypothetical protein DMH01_17670 [Amycolatopsis sp. WAC 04182]
MSRWRACGSAPGCCGTSWRTAEGPQSSETSFSGELAGDVVYSWYVERNEDTNYYVCGWLDHE